MSSFTMILDALAKPPSAASWRRICAALEPWQEEEGIDAALDYLCEVIGEWPADIPTFAPGGFFKRTPEAIAADPRTAFYRYCLLERSEHWRDWGRSTLAEYKPRKPPKFLSLRALGRMRWRDGRALDEDDRLRLIVLMRETDEVGTGELERLRQLLDDQDCQRWSRALYKAWEQDGSKSAQRWAFLQIGSFGELGTLKLDTNKLGGMSSYGQSRRVQQLLTMWAGFGTREAFERIAHFAAFGMLGTRSQDCAVELLEVPAKARGLALPDYVDRELNIYPPLPRDAETWAGAGADKSKLRARLEAAMISQRSFAWAELAGMREALAAQPGLLWTRASAEVVRMSEAGPVDLDGSVLSLASDEGLRVAHPARLSSSVREAWVVALAQLGVAAPFEQLGRRVYGLRDQLVKEGESLKIEPEKLIDHWSPGVYSDDHAFEHYQRPEGALWYVVVEHDFYCFFRDGVLADKDDGITKLEIRSVFTDSEDPVWAKDPVAISEANYALAQLLARPDPER